MNETLAAPTARREDHHLKTPWQCQPLFAHFRKLFNWHFASVRPRQDASGNWQ